MNSNTSSNTPQRINELSLLYWRSATPKKCESESVDEAVKKYSIFAKNNCLQAPLSRATPGLISVGDSLTRFDELTSGIDYWINVVSEVNAPVGKNEKERYLELNSLFGAYQKYLWDSVHPSRSSSTSSVDVISRQTKAKSLLTSLPPGKNKDFFESLCDRIDSLEEMAYEEWPEQKALNFLSCIAFFEFIKKERPTKKPSLVLTYDGFLKAEWFKSQNYRVTIVFSGGDSAKVYWVYPKQRSMAGVNRGFQEGEIELIDEIIPKEVEKLFNE